MTTPLSANQAPAINCGVSAWRRNDNACTLQKRTAMALSQARADHNKQSLALYLRASV